MKKTNTAQTVLDALRQNCDGVRPQLTSKLTDLNLDSLSFIAVLVELEEALGIEFDERQLGIHEYENVGDLVAAAEKLSEQKKNAEGSEGCTSL